MSNRELPATVDIAIVGPGSPAWAWHSAPPGGRSDFVVLEKATPSGNVA